MMMAQRFFARGKRVAAAEGIEQLSTRMYTSLSELIRGWGKNVFAGGRDSVPWGIFGRILFPFLLLSAPLFTIVPAALIAVNLIQPINPDLLLWAIIAQSAQLLWWISVYVRMKVSSLYALISPIGALMVLYIFARAALRGQKVVWKDREYVSR